MSDITTVWTGLRGDWQVAGADLQSGNDLASAALISLFSWRVAGPDDVLSDGSSDPKGWHGDATSDVALGSRLWQLARAKRTQETLNDAQGFALEALQWMLDDGVVVNIDVYAEWQPGQQLSLQVTFFRVDGTTQVVNYAWAWDGLNITQPTAIVL